MIGNICRSGKAYTLKSALDLEKQQSIAFSGCWRSGFFFALLLTFGLNPSYPGESHH